MLLERVEPLDVSNAGDVFDRQRVVIDGQRAVQLRAELLFKGLLLVERLLPLLLLPADDVLNRAQAHAQRGCAPSAERLCTRAGLLAAAANGRKGGRPRKVDDVDAAKARQLREKGIAATDIAKMLGVSRATAYRYLSDDASLSA
jgi:hypothetical protein